MNKRPSSLEPTKPGVSRAGNNAGPLPALPHDIRAALIDLLAETLALDFQQFPDIMVKTPPRTNRKVLGESLGTSQTDLLDSA